ncbi:hypothetical protein CDO73_15905 [Saccharibacillus sp. O23]|uniref:tautomerase family protein n=1 Tax=Saccharibacillus sp. O23 TaxID=2009338 RepID=UPI000B4E2A35|nr:tautomerase family protein [Saccharibacillus sp. O23]OWR29149.1 hypothetical protein CDO73_15905 [Saccharibacillus sp. O23]
MPFIRTSYRKDRHEPERLNVCANSLMESLIEHFRVPPDDFFHVFHAIEPDGFFYSSDYLNVDRSDELLMIEIVLGPGRSLERKRRFYEDAAKRIAERCEVRLEDVMIILVETAPANWSFGLGQAQMIDSPPGWIEEPAASGVRQEDPLRTLADRPNETSGASVLPALGSVKDAAGRAYAEIAPVFADHTRRVLFGEAWSDPALPPRERSLITLSSLVTNGALEQLPYHIELAREHGIDDEEIAALCSHLAFYAGWPRAASALEILKKESSDA